MILIAIFLIDSVEIIKVNMAIRHMHILNVLWLRLPPKAFVSICKVFLGIVWLIENQENHYKFWRRLKTWAFVIYFIIILAFQTWAVACLILLTQHK